MEILNRLYEIVNKIIVLDSIANLVTASVFLVVFILFRRPFLRGVLSLIERIVRRRRPNFKPNLFPLLQAPLGWFLTFGALLWCLRVIRFTPELAALLQKILLSCVIASMFWIGYQILDFYASRLFARGEETGRQYDKTLVQFLISVIKVVVGILGGFTVLSMWVSNLSGLLAGLGLGGLAFALAAQEAAGNIIGSISIMLDRPFVVGDWIATSDIEGTVEHIGFRSTRIRTFGQALVSVPNSKLSSTSITNWSRMGKRRIMFHVSLPYSSATEQIRTLTKKIRELVGGDFRINQDFVCVNLEELGDYSLNILVYFFINSVEYTEMLAVQEEVKLQILDLIRSMGLEIAFPTSNVVLQPAIGDQKATEHSGVRADD